MLKREKAAGVSDQARHKLRIALKNLRYGVDFFDGLFGSAKSRRAYAKRMAALQDLLGLRNDIVVARIILERASGGDGPGGGPDPGIHPGLVCPRCPSADKAISKS